MLKNDSVRGTPVLVSLLVVGLESSCIYIYDMYMYAYIQTHNGSIFASTRYTCQKDWMESLGLSTSHPNRRSQILSPG